MRGKVKATPPHRNEPRITPAYAGKRPVWIAASRHGWDHPRLCGEKSSLSFVKMILSGSPPPMRGKGVRLTASGVYGRITPAYAGKSIQLSSYGQGDWDHPRLCGEKSLRSAGRTSQAGSPPPMRGKEAPDLYRQQGKGITPAYAGKSQRLSPTASSHEDHPRLCGEKIQAREAAGLPAGSPPPMRGKAVCVPK